MRFKKNKLIKIFAFTAICIIMGSCNKSGEGRNVDISLTPSLIENSERVEASTPSEVGERIESPTPTESAVEYQSQPAITLTIVNGTVMPYCNPILEPEIDFHPANNTGILLSGNLILCNYPGNAFDLDEGVRGTISPVNREADPPGMDIYFVYGTGIETTAEVFALNGTLLSIDSQPDLRMGTPSPDIPPSRERCLYSIENWGLLSVWLDYGSVICILTSEGNLGYLQVDQLSWPDVTPYGELVVQITFLIWEEPLE